MSRVFSALVRSRTYRVPSLRDSVDAFLENRAAVVPCAYLTPEERYALLQQHGDFSLAYSTAVQDDLSYFGDTSGYIAFATKMGGHFALGDPVAPPGEHETYIRRFIEAAGRPWFVQIGHKTATTLAELGYQVNCVGIDTRLHLPAHDFSGSRNETVRYSERWLLKNGYTIAEDNGSTASFDQVRQLSEEWLTQRIVNRREMRFLNRPFKPAVGEGMRRFLLFDPNETPVALLDFDPIFSRSEGIGYTTAFKRKRNDVTPHAEIGMTKYAVDRFRQEGRRVVTLGLSPLAGISASGFNESRFWNAMFRRAFESRMVNHHIFNLRGQAAFKRRFHGQEEPLYIAFRKGTATEMTGLLRLCKAL